MASGMPDSSPSSGKGSGHVGMKNDDGREDGKGWNKGSSPFGGDGVAKFTSEKLVGVEPNEGLTELVSKGTKGLGKVIE